MASNRETEKSSPESEVKTALVVSFAASYRNPDGSSLENPIEVIIRPDQNFAVGWDMLNEYDKNVRMPKFLEFQNRISELLSSPDSNDPKALRDKLEEQFGDFDSIAYTKTDINLVKVITTDQGSIAVIGTSDYIYGPIIVRNGQLLYGLSLVSTSILELVGPKRGYRSQFKIYTVPLQEDDSLILINDGISPALYNLDPKRRSLVDLQVSTSNERFNAILASKGQQLVENLLDSVSDSKKMPRYLGTIVLDYSKKPVTDVEPVTPPIEIAPTQPEPSPEQLFSRIWDNAFSEEPNAFQLANDVNRLLKTGELSEGEKTFLRRVGGSEKLQDHWKKALFDVIPRDTEKYIKTADALGIDINSLAERMVQPEVLLIDPYKNLLQQVNEELVKTNKDTVSFAATPESMTRYMNGIKVDAPMAGELKVHNALAQTTEGKLKTTGFISSGMGEISFGVSLTNKPGGELLVKVEKLDLPRRLKWAGGMIRGYMDKLNEVIIKSVNEKIDPSWQVKGFHIEEDQVVFDFAKKPSK